MFPKPKRYENEEYKEFIRNRACCVPRCNRKNRLGPNRGKVDPHHTKSKGSGGSDLTCVPACDFHHTESHTIGQVTFQKKYGVDFKEVQISCLQQFIEEKCDE